MKNLLLNIILIFNVTTIFCQPIKVVFTGGPGTGKTTLIEALEKKGYNTVSEAATAVILEEQKNGNMQPWKELEKFQLRIIDKQKTLLDQALKRTNNFNFIFLDRAYPDGLAYFKLNNITPPNKITNMSKTFIYDYVFVLDFLDNYSSSQVRREGREEAQKIHNLLKDVYKELGYNVISVPALSVAKRVDFVLNKLQPIDMEKPNAIS